MANLVVEFTKMHGAVNDFVVIDNRFFAFDDVALSTLAELACRRRYGIGADGLLALCPAEDGLDFRMKYFNADGSRGGMCGNGARCLAQFAADGGVESRPVRFITDDGSYEADIGPPGSTRSVRLWVPDPRAFVPTVEISSDTWPGSAVSSIFTGVPHAVCFVDEVASVPVAAWGRELRYDSAFPEGTNVDFVQVAGSDPSRILVRTYERGVEAETQACGTGAVAAAISSWHFGRVGEPPIRVTMAGGDLVVGFRVKNDRPADVYLEGPVVRVFRGTIEVPGETL